MKYEVIVNRKPIKHIYLRVRYPNCILVTCSHRVSMNHIHQLIDEKQPWIDRKLAEQHLPHSEDRTINSDSCLRLADTIYTIEIRSADRNRISVSDQKILLETTDPENESIKQELILKWYAKTFSEYARRRCTALYRDHATSYHHLPANIAIRNMRSRWGSYSKKTDTLALSVSLGAYPAKTIDSVICHELAHTVHMNHQAEFYRILDNVMPDYREASQALKQKKPVVNWFLAD
ncbi:MAG: M48 family metallopeptidase [Anaerofustis sp.]